MAIHHVTGSSAPVHGGAVIRSATTADLPGVLALIRELADYEREPEAVVASVADLAASLFGPDAVAHCHVAERGGRLVGIAVWFRNFSTWRGKPGLYLEDLYVLPAERGTGVGRMLIETLRAIAAERGYDRMDWSVLDWNTEAAAFYHRIGAEPTDGWTTWRLTLHQ